MTHHPRISRRSFLRTAAAGTAAVGGGTLLTGCSDGSSTAATGSSSAQSELSGVLPSYIPVEYVKPDLPGKDGSSPGFLHFPTDPVQSVEEPPGSGQSYQAMTPAWWPAPKQPNPYFDAMNEALNSKYSFTIVPGSDYKAKLAAVTAAGNVPHQTVMTDWDAPARLSQAVPGLFADLSPYLSGDNVKEYPNLANLPSDAWSMCVFDGKLMGVPFPEALFMDQLFYRKDILDKLGGEPPKNGEDLLALAKLATDERNGVWGMGDVWIEAQRLFHAQVNWRRDGDGNLVHRYETPEYEEALAFARKFFDAGVVHPDIVAGNTDGIKELFEGGHMVMYVDGIGSWHEAYQRQVNNPEFNMQVFPPYSGDGTSDPTYIQPEPARIYSFVRKDASEKQIREMLGTCNFAAAPFGTREYNLVNFGIEGTHHTAGENGVLALNERGQAEVTATYFFLAGRPNALTQAHLPEFVKSRHAWELEAVPYVVQELYHGIRVEEPAQYSGQNGINQPVDDLSKSIYLGRKPVSAHKQAVKEWRQRGGDKLREFYAKVLEDAGR